MPKSSVNRVRDEELADYACDRCRGRKISCDRQLPRCGRCEKDQQGCAYSRAGVLKRERKKRSRATVDDESSIVSSTAPHSSKGPSAELLSHLAPDVDLAQRCVEDGGGGEVGTALSRLSTAASAMWVTAPGEGEQGVSTVYHVFSSRAEEFAAVFASTMQRGRPLMAPPPDHVLDHLRNARPELVSPRAWLVMFYSIILSWTTSMDPSDELTRQHLRHNLWLAFNDTRVLLEPSDVNVQALLLLAIHVEEFTTPTLCWMLISTACRMLQALGLESGRLSQQEAEQRRLLFWNVEMMDKGLALIFGRPPTNHRAFTKRVPMPTLKQLLLFRPHTTDESAPGTFGAHFLYHMLAGSRLMGSIWHVLHDEDNPSEHSIVARLAEVEAWYMRASEVLCAAATSERPFLDESAAKSVDIGMCSLTFHYHYLVILLCRDLDGKRGRRTESAEALLGLLPSLISDSQEVFNGMVWQLICSPFTAFLVLLREISSSNDTLDKKRWLGSMQQLAPFLQAMARSNALAAKLETEAVVLFKYAASQVESAPAEATTLSSGACHHSLQSDCPPLAGQLPLDSAFASESFGDLDIWSNQLFGELLSEWLPVDL